MRACASTFKPNNTMKRKHILGAALLAATALFASCEYEYDMPDGSDVTSDYTFESSMNDVVRRDLTAAGYQWDGDDYMNYTFIEKNADGETIRTYNLAESTRKPFEKRTSAGGAKSVEVEVNSYGKKTSTGQRRHVYVYRFRPFTLSPSKVTNIILAPYLNYTRTQP